MALPVEIQGLLEQGLVSIYNDPVHHFDWRIRRQIYHYFQQLDPKRGKRAHGWVAVLAAKQVLPIFTNTFPDDDVPNKLIEWAERIVQGKAKLKSKKVNELLDTGYLNTGIDAICWRPKLAYNAEYAGEATYKALLEASGHWDLLDNVEHLQTNKYSSGEEVVSLGGTDSVAEGGNSLNFNDLDIAHLAAFSDTASAAAIAAACNVTKRKLNRKKLLAFWTWWIEEAIPQAWASR